MKYMWMALLGLTPLILCGIIYLVIGFYRGRCPQCHKHGLRLANEDDDKSKNAEYVCDYCGNKFTLNE